MLEELDAGEYEGRRRQRSCTLIYPSIPISRLSIKEADYPWIYLKPAVIG
jgi:hypothetical protein